MVYAAPGEFSNTAILKKFTTSADVTKGDIVTITPAASPTVKKCDASGNAPYAVATATATSGNTVMCVVYGEVSVTADGNCYTGAIVGGVSGKAKLVALPFQTLAPAAGPCPLGKVTDGAANTGIATVFVGLVV